MYVCVQLFHSLISPVTEPFVLKYIYKPPIKNKQITQKCVDDMLQSTTKETPMVLLIDNTYTTTSYIEDSIFSRRSVKLIVRLQT